MTDPAETGPEPTLAVVVVSYNNADLIGPCIESVLPQLPTDGSTLVVVDNDSSDGTADVIERDWPDVKVIRAASNLGFGRGCNLGVAATRARFLLLVNPDSRMEPGCIDALLEMADRRPAVGLYGGQTLAPDGVLDPRSCAGRPTLWSLTCFALGLSSLFAGNRWLNPEGIGGWRRDDERTVGVITGCLLLARQEVWRELDGFDERFFMYGEDTDLSIRAAAEGYTPAISPAARLVHVVGGSSSSADKMIMLYKGKVTLIRKVWSGSAQKLAFGLLAGGVAARARMARLAQALLPRGDTRERRSAPDSWSGLWSRRREWSDGW